MTNELSTLLKQHRIPTEFTRGEIVYCRAVFAIDGTAANR